MAKNEVVEEVATKKWNEMSVSEKVEAMPIYKETVNQKIKELKNKLANERKKLKALEMEEKALKYDLLMAQEKKGE